MRVTVKCEQYFQTGDKLISLCVPFFKGAVKSEIILVLCVIFQQTPKDKSQFKTKYRYIKIEKYRFVFISFTVPYMPVFFCMFT